MDVTVDQLVRRSAVLKRELVAFARQGRPGRELSEAVTARFGNPVVSTDEELTNFVDQFVLQVRLSDGRTVLERFVRSRGELPRAERDMLRGWGDPVEGMFEVEALDGETLVCTNVIDELPYRIRSNMGAQLFRDRLPPGTLLLVRVVPVLDEWLISGMSIIFTPAQRDAALVAAYEVARKSPALVFRNPAKLEFGRRLQAEDRAAFVAHFGDDQVVVPGAELVERWAAFWRYRHGDGAAPRADLSGPAEGSTVGLIYDERHGLGFYKEFGALAELFAHPELIDDPLRAEVLEDYLYDTEASGVPLVRCVQRYPEGADALLAKVLRRPRFRWARDGEEVLRRFKPGFLDEPLPQVLQISDLLADAVRRSADASVVTDEILR